MNLLVTGAAGFIGSNFVYHLLEHNPDQTIVALDKLTYAGNLDNFSKLKNEQRKRFEFIKGDINNQQELERIFEKKDIHIVVHFAAESHVDRSIQDAKIFIETNVLGTQTLLEVCRRYWKTQRSWLPGRLFLHISTDEVYGSLGPTGLFTEKSPLDPHSPYSASKAAADLTVKAYIDTHGLPAIITRCCNNYGPYQFPEKLIPLMIQNALSHKQLPIYGDGLQVRDWIHVQDHCRALDLVIQKGRVGEVYNIGANCERTNVVTVREVIQILRELTGDEEISTDLIQHIQDRPGHDRRYAIDASKIKQELDWKPEVSFKAGLHQTVEWYIENREWTQKIISGEYLDFYEKNYTQRSGK